MTALSTKDKLFYSWQNRVYKKGCRYFIENALKEILKDPELDYELEQDMKGKSGAPILSDVIFTKISNSYAFVADITFCATDDDNKKYPNPNVLIELGYASRTLGWDRIILLMNEAFGKIEDLPVDISDRRNPIAYNLPDGSSKELIESEFSKVVNILKDAIKITKEAELLSVYDALKKMDKLCLDILNKFIVELSINHQDIDSKLSALKLISLDLNSLKTGTGTSRLFDLDLVYVDFQSELDCYLKLTTKGQQAIKILNPTLTLPTPGIFFA